jgi:bifunctional UDP-N-acetylglucosamine pyrophosphorylase/glucosamine-1-phosphate N-acetyltransferase
MKALILTGGTARNLVPFSSTRPKAMAVVGNGPLMSRTLAHLREVGVADVTVVLGQTGDKVKTTFGDGQEMGLHITYLEQKAHGGIADAILDARRRFIPGEYFILVYGDIVASANLFHQAMQSFNSFKGPIACVCLPGPPTGRYGNVYLSGTRITRIVEKPATAGLGNYVLAGVFVLPVEVFSILEHSGGDMENVFASLVRSPGLNASIWEQGWIDVEYPWDILAANRMVMDTWEESSISRHATIEGNVTLSGPVRIERGSVVKAGAVLAGPCYIGRNCYVGNNALVRSYSSMGHFSSIGYGAELKNCVLFGNSSIGRLSFVGDSVIGEHVDIGAGTMTVNGNLDGSTVAVDVRDERVDSGLTKLGAFVGDDVKVGAGNTLAAGTVLMPATMVPHHTTVGVR